MNVRMEYEAENVDWECVSGMLRAVGMAHYSSDVHRRAFLNSYFAVFVFDDRRLVAIGRMISDGEYQSAIYDVAVLPEYQGCGIGKQIIRRLNRMLKMPPAFRSSIALSENFMVGILTRPPLGGHG